MCDSIHSECKCCGACNKAPTASLSLIEKLDYAEKVQDDFDNICQEITKAFDCGNKTVAQMEEHIEYMEEWLNE